MSSSLRSTTARLLPPLHPRRAAPLAHVAAAFIEEDGGRCNFPAKIFATLWYLLVLPDAQTRLHRQLHRKRVPWYSLSRLTGITVAFANVITMPLSWGLLIAGRRNASRLISLGVLLNPPSVSLGALLATELSSALIKKLLALGSGTVNVITAPFKSKSSDDDESNANTSSNASTPAPAPAAAATSAPAPAAAPASAPASTRASTPAPAPTPKA